jgi:hypothetical protein
MHNPLKLHKTPQNTTPTPQNTMYAIPVAVCRYNTVQYKEYVSYTDKIRYVHGCCNGMIFWWSFFEFCGVKLECPQIHPYHGIVKMDALQSLLALRVGRIISSYYYINLQYPLAFEYRALHRDNLWFSFNLHLSKNSG